jgi:hypothetical protein
MSAYRIWKVLVVLLCLVWLVGSVFYYGMYERFLKDGGDAWGYYIYLPSAFVSGDLTTLEYIAEVRKGFSPWSIDTSLNHLGVPELYIAPNGNPVIKYTSGVALMLSPFFILAHGIAWLSHYDADGFNPVYWLSMYFGVIVWVLLGMAVLYKTMVRYVRPGIALATLALIAIGSNLYYFLVYNSPMSHAPLFALYALLIWLTDRFYRQPRWTDAFGIGVLCGLITMIRPVELICVFIPLLWTIKGLKDRWQFILRQYRYYLLAGVGFVLSLIPQLLYWKLTTGSWLYYSYGEEGFNFLNPRVWKGLTGFMNGWLVYTPLFLLSLPGLWYLYRQHRGVLYRWRCSWYFMCTSYSVGTIGITSIRSVPGLWWRRMRSWRFPWRWVSSIYPGAGANTL